MTVAGLTPRAIVEPQTVDELAECVGALYAHDTAFAFAGGGTELELGNPPRALDTLVRTTACNRVIDYAPEDQTVTIEAGITLAQVAGVLARERQFLAIDGPHPDRTTVGGAIATNLYGARRLRYGSIKDSIVGVEIVRPDGTRARGGGKVVKNVAGFDIPKLMVGSLGTLGAIVNATFRVFPIEESRATMTYRGASLAALVQIGDELIRETLVPAAVVAFDAESGERYDCCVTFEGFEGGVAQQMETAASIAVRLGLSADVAANGSSVPCDARERAVREEQAWRVTLSARPSALAGFLSAVSFPHGSRRAIYPLLGTAFVAADALDAATIASWRAALDGGSVVVNAMPNQARETIDTWGEPPSAALAIMRRLKANFDPKGLCNAGRFIGGL